MQKSHFLLLKKFKKKESAQLCPEVTFEPHCRTANPKRPSLVTTWTAEPQNCVLGLTWGTPWPISSPSSLLTPATTSSPGSTRPPGKPSIPSNLTTQPEVLLSDYKLIFDKVLNKMASFHFEEVNFAPRSPMGCLRQLAYEFILKRFHLWSLRWVFAKMLYRRNLRHRLGEKTGGSLLLAEYWVGYAWTWRDWSVNGAS